MPYKVEFIDRPGIVEITLTASITGEDLDDVTRSAIEAGVIHQTHRYLVQFTEPVITASLISVFNLPAQYLAQQLDRLSRIAVVNPQAEADREIVRFYETVCLNRGWLAKSFGQRQEAMDWLFQDSTAPHSE